MTDWTSGAVAATPRRCGAFPARPTLPHASTDASQMQISHSRWTYGQRIQEASPCPPASTIEGRIGPPTAPGPSTMPLCAALCRSLHGRRAKSPFSLRVGSDFEPEGRGFESLPACHFHGLIQMVMRFPIDTRPSRSSKGLEFGLGLARKSTV